MPPHRLERHLGAELGRARDLEERVAFAQSAVLGQRAPGLAHEPHRRALDLLAPQRADQERVGHGRTLARVDAGRSRRTPSPPARSASAGSPTSSTPPQAGALGTATVELENAGAGRVARRARSPTTGSTSSATRSTGTACARRSPRLEPGARAEVELASGRRCRPAATGSPSTSCSRTATGSRRSATRLLAADVDVRPRDASDAVAHLPPNVEPAADWHELVRAAHEEGYAAVGGAIESRERELRAYRPGGGRNPSFPRAARLPVAAAAARAELRGRRPAGLAARGRRAVDLRRADHSSTAIRSSTRLNTHAPRPRARPPPRRTGRRRPTRAGTWP